MTEAINIGVRRQKEIKGEALQEMQRKDAKVYKHAGVVFARVPGADKLNARLTSDDGDADDATPVGDQVDAGGDATALESQG